MKTKTANLRRLDILGHGDLSSKRESVPARLKQWRQRLGCYSIFAAFPAMAVSHVQEARAKDAKKPEPRVAGRTVNFLERLTKTCSSPGLLKRQSKFLLPHQKGSFDMLIPLAGNDDCPGRAIPGGNYTAAAPYTDSGDTTGANDTVSRAHYIHYIYYNYDAFGPDHVYSFTLTGRGPNPQIEVSTTSGTYRPLIYVLQGGSAGACPAGTGNLAYNELALFDSRWTNGSTATLGMRFLPLNVPLHLFIDSRFNDASGSGPYAIRMQDVTIAPSGTNPIDRAELFVRQHYLDFLSREPEAGEPWSAILNNCPDPFNTDPNSPSASCDRIQVSASFFLSPEFRLKGSYVFTFYRVAFDRLADFSEIIPDMQSVTGQTPADTSARRAAFPLSFVQRQEFRTRFDHLSDAAFVDALLGRYGLSAITTPDPQQPEGERKVVLTRAELTSRLESGALTRAQVLRAVVESDEVSAAEFNRAFVAMQYYGYLRRTPEPTGYNVWLNYLRARPGDFRTMVNGFVNSTEYRMRFGQP